MTYILLPLYFQRNAAIALGNLADPEELVREYAAWALGKIATNKAKQVIEAARASKTSLSVQQQITTALLSI